MKETGEVRSLQIALGAYVVVFVMKLVVYFATHVMAMLAEALHTLSDIFVTGFLLVALIWSRKKPDKDYMFGYGRAQNAAALVAATLFISFTSYKLYEEAIPRLFEPAQGAYQNLWLALGVILVSMLIAAIPLLNLYRQKQRGAAARSQFLESINDELGLLAALVGTLFIMGGQPIADPIASITVATIIAYNGIKLLLENFRLLIGKSPGPEYLAEIERRARSVPGVLGVHDLAAEYVGQDVIHAGMHIEVRRGLPVEEADRIAEEVIQRVHAGADAGHCVIHVDAAGPGSAEQAQLIRRSPTGILEDEHRVIQKVVGMLPALAEALEAGRPVEVDTLRSIVEFMRTFADKCHHGKEETYLFRVLERSGVPIHGCPLGALNHEHQQGRALVAELAEATDAYTAGDPSARERLVGTLRGLIELYPGHIWKEDYLLFPLTNKVLRPEQQQDLLEKFDGVEEAFGRDTHRRFERLADTLAV